MEEARKLSKEETGPIPANARDPGHSLPPALLLAAMQALVAAASLVVEIVAGRMLAPWLGMSLYTWTSVIAVVLAGFSAGHWAGGRIAGMPAGRALALTAWSMTGAAVTTALAGLILQWSAPGVIPGLGNPLAAIVVLTTLAFFLPSFFAGIPAPVLARVAIEAAPDRTGQALGAMFAAGALGAIGGTLAAGFLFISWLGSGGTLAAVTATYVVLSLILFHLARRAGARVSIPAVLAATALVALIGGAGLARADPCTVESRYFCIRVIDVSADYGEEARLMVLDHLGHGVSVKNDPARMVTPHGMLFDRLARDSMGSKAFSAFFIGGGSYTVPRAWAASGAAGSMTIAEIDPEVTRVAETEFWFDPASARVVHEDARLVLAREDQRYDIIIGDAFTDIAVPQHLVTREFFELVRSRLDPGGTYLMNVVDHAGRLQALAAMARTLGAVFPSIEIWTERGRASPDERLVFVIRAGEKPGAISEITTPAPDAMLFSRMPEQLVASLIEARQPPVLTDDYAPIDRLMGRLD